MEQPKEQIIIDGVDVSGCLFYQSNFEEDYDVKIKHFCSNWHNSCESANNSNCYFKQLAHKTQRLENTTRRFNACNNLLDKLIEALGYNPDEIEDIYNFDELLETIKSERNKNLKTKRRDNEVSQDFGRLKQECEELEKKLEFKDNENLNLNKKYRQEQYERRNYLKALEEIEGLIKNFCKDCNDYEDCNWDKEGCYYSLIPNLKDIINKAKKQK